MTSCASGIPLINDSNSNRLSRTYAKYVAHISFLSRTWSCDSSQVILNRYVMLDCDWSHMTKVE